MNLDWLVYANQNKTRDMPISNQLIQAMGSVLPNMGLGFEVLSGGQPAIGTSDRRVGSTRHDEGNAADGYFTKEGRRLNWQNEEDRAVILEALTGLKEAGLTGFGMGPGYMAPGMVHLGYGTPAVWGADGKGANAPRWLQNWYLNTGRAYEGQSYINQTLNEGILRDRLNRRQVSGERPEPKEYPNKFARMYDSIVGVRDANPNPNAGRRSLDMQNRILERGGLAARESMGFEPESLGFNGAAPYTLDRGSMPSEELGFSDIEEINPLRYSYSRALDSAEFDAMTAEAVAKQLDDTFNSPNYRKAGGRSSDIAAAQNSPESFKTYSDQPTRSGTSGVTPEMIADSARASTSNEGAGQTAADLSTQEGNNRRQMFADVLQTLGVGLGQMSRGQPINAIEQVAAMQQRRAEAAQQAKRDEFNQAMQQERLAMERQRVNMELQKFGLERERFKQNLAANRPVNFSPIRARYPQLGELIDLYEQNPYNESIRNQILNATTDLATQELEQDPTMPPGASELLTGYLEGNIDDAQFAGFVSQLPKPQADLMLSTVDAFKSPDLTPAQRHAEQLTDNQIKIGEVRPENRAQAMNTNLERVLRAEGSGTLEPYDASQERRNAAAKIRDEEGRKYYAELETSRRLAEGMGANLDLAAKTTLDLIISGKSTGRGSTFLASLSSTLESTAETAKIAEVMGFDESETASRVEAIDAASRGLAFVVAKQMLSGQGSVTDSERAQILRMLFSADQTNETRYAAIRRLQALSDADILAARSYQEIVKPGDFMHDNYQEGYSASERMRTLGAQISGSMTSYHMAHALYMQDRENSELASVFEDPDEVIKVFQDSIPQMTKSEALLFADSLIQIWHPEKGEGYAVYRDMDGNVAKIRVDD